MVWMVEGECGGIKLLFVSITINLICPCIRFGYLQFNLLQSMVKKMADGYCGGIVFLFVSNTINQFNLFLYHNPRWGRKIGVEQSTVDIMFIFDPKTITLIKGRFASMVRMKESLRKIKLTFASDTTYLICSCIGIGHMHFEFGEEC